jgi:cytochrome c-type biogenesis protein CcmH/NrfG
VAGKGWALRQDFELNAEQKRPGMADGSLARMDIPAQAGPPRAARILVELGLTCAAMGEDQAAIAALREAVALKPGLAEAWQALAELLRAAGDAQAARSAKAECQRRATAEVKTTRPVKSAPSGKREAAVRQLRERLAGMPGAGADEFLRARLRQNPEDASALRLLGEAALAQTRNADAEKLLARGLALAPDDTALRHLYAVALFRQGKEALALPHAEGIVAQDKRNIAYRTLLASTLASIGDVKRAADMYQGILKDTPQHDELWMNYGQALKHAGRRTESIEAFRHSLRLAPGRGEAHWSLQNLSAAPAEAGDVAAMRAQLASGRLTPESRFHFEYALAYALEKSGEYAESFSHYAAGAKAWRGLLHYSADDTAERVARAASFFTSDRLAAQSGGHPDPAPIFVLGMPRAGSTLIEQILASHSLIEGTQELPEIRHIVEELDRRTGAPYPACLAGMAPEELAALGERYMARTRIYRRSDKPYFIDKMPANWIDIGLIQMILPHAKIIDARRDPMANCFAAFKKFFGTGQVFTYDLTELGRYYRDYTRLLAHFDAVLPGRVHRVVYEDMVADTDTEIRRLLDYCGVTFEPACLRFWETDRTVTTASSEQVRKPIFRDGLDQWRHFEPWLHPLKDALAARDAGSAAA